MAGQDLPACERFLCGVQEFLFFLPHTLPAPITLPSPARPGLALGKAGSAVGSPRTPREKCPSAARCKRRLFGYQTSSSNLCRANLNIAVSCHLPRGPETTRKRKKRKEEPLQRLSCVFERIVLSESTVQTTPESCTCRYERVCACLDGTILLTGLQFFHMTCLGGGRLGVGGGNPGTRRRQQLQDFPCMDLFISSLPQIDFPSLFIIGAYGTACKPFHWLTTL